MKEINTCEPTQSGLLSPPLPDILYLLSLFNSVLLVECFLGARHCVHTGRSRLKSRLNDFIVAFLHLVTIQFPSQYLEGPDNVSHYWQTTESSAVQAGLRPRGPPRPVTSASPSHTEVWEPLPRPPPSTHSPGPLRPVPFRHPRGQLGAGTRGAVWAPTFAPAR